MHKAAGKPPPPPEFGDAFGGVGVDLGRRDVVGKIGLKTAQVGTSLGEERHAVDASFLVMLHAEIRVEADCVESGPQLAQAGARALSEDTIYVPIAAPAPQHAVKSTHSVVRKLDGTVARGVPEIGVADFRLFGRDDAGRKTESFVLATAAREEAGGAELDQGVVGHDARVLELRTDDGGFMAVAALVVRSNLWAQQ